MVLLTGRKRRAVDNARPIANAIEGSVHDDSFEEVQDEEGGASGSVEEVSLNRLVAPPPLAPNPTNATGTPYVCALDDVLL